MDMVIMIF